VLTGLMVRILSKTLMPTCGVVFGWMLATCLLQLSATQLPPAGIADSGRCGKQCSRRAMSAAGDGSSQTAGEQNFVAFAYSRRGLWAQRARAARTL